ncbi:ABC transporter permease [Vallitalea longa]|uniref:ABC transporter permease n=1 Tax=Vallitalea longa TaxID=2936439 RepID=A0A9W6DGF0_9FIRM|nr:ABC transporter permease [Vallitalea longa]GKX32236.1 ABC transporter permease [Vallitalea longa]
MLLKLVNKEMKYQLKSITFYIFCISVIVFYVTQFSGDIKREEELYQSPIEILEEGSLFSIVSYEDEIHVTYEQELKMLHDLLLRDEEKGYYVGLANSSIIRYIDLDNKKMELISSFKKEIERKEINEDEYNNILKTLRKELGNNSIYTNEIITNLCERELRNNEYMENQTQILETEKVTGSYARLFADYIGIAVGFFAVFIAGFTLVRDKKHRTYEIVYSKKISSVKYLLSKYIGNVILIFIVVLILAGYTTYKFSIAYDNIDYLAFFKYSFTWILPTIMLVTSLAYLLQIIFDNGIVPVIIQFIYWYYSMSFCNNQYNITKYIIRYNSVTGLSEYEQVASNIMVNRLVILVVSIILLVISMWIFSKKRGNICGKN